MITKSHAVSAGRSAPASHHDLAADAITAVRRACADRRWDSVLEMVAEFRRTNPPAVQFEQSAVIALRALDRYDEAEQVLEQATKSFGDQFWILAERAKLSLRRGNGIRAVEQSSELRQRFPKAAEGYSCGLTALRLLRRFEDATALSDAAIRLFPHARWPREERIRLFENQRNWEAVVVEADALLSISETAHQFASRAAVQALRRLNRLSDAEARLGKAVDHNAAEPWIYLEGAENSQARRDFQTADQRLSIGVQNHPKNIDLALAYAVRPRRDSVERRRERGDERAVERLEQLVERFPEAPEAVSALAEALISIQQVTRAESLLVSDLERLSKHAPTAILWARTALFLDNLDEAIRRYRIIVEWFPNFHFGYEGLVNALSRRGDCQEAETICTAAITRFPLSVPLLSAHATIAESAGNIKKALERVEKLNESFPGLIAIQQRLYSLRLKLQDEGTGGIVEAIPTNESAADADPKTIMMQCQSLGGTGIGCEFGMVQRHFGAEPLHLLRWGVLSHASLVQAVELSFDGLELEENLDAWCQPASGDLEYIIRIKKFELSMHTFIYASQSSEQKFRAQMFRRMKFLRQLFIDDLKSCRNLFVRKQESAVTVAEATALHQSLCRYGNNTVLYVQPCDASHPAGSVEQFRPGVLVGYLDHFKQPGVGEESTMISMDLWLQICTRAHALWRASKSGEE